MKKLIRTAFMSLSLLGLTLSSYAQSGCNPNGDLWSYEPGKCVKEIWVIMDPEVEGQIIMTIEYCDLSQFDPGKICWVPLFPE